MITSACTVWEHTGTRTSRHSITELTPKWQTHSFSHLQAIQSFHITAPVCLWRKQKHPVQHALYKKGPQEPESTNLNLFFNIHPRVILKTSTFLSCYLLIQNVPCTLFSLSFFAFNIVASFWLPKGLPSLTRLNYFLLLLHACDVSSNRMNKERLWHFLKVLTCK